MGAVYAAEVSGRAGGKGGGKIKYLMPMRRRNGGGSRMGRMQRMGRIMRMKRMGRNERMGRMGRMEIRTR